VSSRDSEDLRKDFLAAQERDLKPLLEESVAVLEFDYEQAEAMEDFLELAWLSGTRCGRDQVEARTTRKNRGVQSSIISRLETEFRGLMEESADAMNLTVAHTIMMWNYLHDAWLAGSRTCEAELTALCIEVQSDIGEEALRWLGEQGESG
jgi:hypothetical protein